ncbi:MAG: hypothetical protein ACLFTK_09720 [Anaerolineales bacterium]
MQLPFKIDIFQGDVTACRGDVLMAKYSPRSGGLDARVRAALKQAGHPDYTPEVGDYVLVAGIEAYPYDHILIVGTLSIFTLSYPHLRSLGFDMLVALHREGLAAQHLVTTLHGVNTAVANDETEAFRALLLGFADAAAAGKLPQGLQRVTFVEREQYRAELMQTALATFFPQAAPLDLRGMEPKPEAAEAVAETDFERPLADETTPFVFVAMPFADDYDDHYYLALRPAITANGYLCIRLDQEESSFTGDIMEQVKSRIRDAALMVALLDNANPNVYLEVGYAWGVGTPAILILHEDQTPPFDVQGARLLFYRQMYKLKATLQAEIEALSQ